MEKANIKKPPKLTESEKQRIDKIIARLDELYPETKPALNYDNPFQLLIATMLAAQCTDVRVNKVTARLFKKYKSPEDFAITAQEELEEDIRECGLFRTKSKNIIATSKEIVKKHDGFVPQEFDQLVQLPGVGRKTANVVIANAFDIPAFAVDTHVFRLARRLGFSDKNDVFGVEQDLMQKIPEKQWIKAHHWLIFHGRQICRARNPMCEKCSLKDLCQEYEKTNA